MERGVRGESSRREKGELRWSRHRGESTIRMSRGGKPLRSVENDQIVPAVCSTNSGSNGLLVGDRGGTGDHMRTVDRHIWRIR